MRDCPDAWQERDGREVLTADAEAARMTLERIHGAYNHDGSEIQLDYFDVRYYGHVEFENAFAAAFRQRETERLAARRAARDAGVTVGKAANLNGPGPAVVHALIRTGDGKLVLACGARVARYNLGRVADGEPVTCSRCGKHGR